MPKPLAHLLCMLLCVLLARGASAQAGNGHDHSSTARVRAMLLAQPIQLDGRLNEEAWSRVSAATDFRQQDPHEGEAASQGTEVRFLFDRDALYVGARMFDVLGAAGVRTRMARRDQINEGDNLQLIIDTFHDHTGRTMFMVNPSGARGDAGQASSFMDPAWDPIWDAATQIDSLGWTAEIRIPFSQLRFPTAREQTWGLQVWRFVERLNEVQMWSFWGKQENGGPARFGHLEGLQVEPRGLGLEALPYVVTRAEDVTPAQPGTPLRAAREYGVRLGADLKALLTSTLTLDATINPDFGQVEVDPAVVNLSAFETFFEEKRPFFVEGSGLFGFGGFSCYFCSNVSSLSLFYSRRIGRRPQGSVSGNPRFVEIPENSTILGAAKVTGRTRSGYQIGVLNALTAPEDAQAISAAGTAFEREVEPLSNYFVGRLRRNYDSGNLTLGVIGTSVLRRFQNDELRELMPEHAEAVGADFNLFWGNRRYNLMGNVALTQVTGDAGALLRLQHSSARYFQRPDREAGSNSFLTDHYDPELSAMRGAGAYVRLAKVAGNWLWETAVNLRTPGFEANDLAFLTRADYAWFNGNVMRQWLRPTSLYRQWSLTLGGQQQYNFDGDINDRQLHIGSFGQLANYWNVNAFAIYRPERDDDQVTRGGAVVRRAGNWYANLNINTDARKRLVLGGSANYTQSTEGTFAYGTGLSVRYKPASSVSLSVGPSFGRTGSAVQYVARFADASATHFFAQRVVFADLRQYTFSFDTRLSATFTPTLTLELYAQPFTSSADYSGFKEFVAPRVLEKRPFDATQIRRIDSTQPDRPASYEIDPDRDPGTASFRFDDPDFNVRSLRGNAVLRWEYRPGSTVFLVWQQQRSEARFTGDFDLTRDADGIFRDPPDNIFLIKMTYWLGR
jgi:hypothetical protein